MTESKRKVVYIAGPYRAKNEFDVQRNIDRAGKYALSYWERGYAVICPHKNTSMFTGAHGLPDDVWLEGDFELIRRCDIVVMIPGWENSVGAKAEYELALTLGKQIIIESRHVENT